MLELKSLGPLAPAQVKMIEEQIGALAEKLRKNIVTVEKIDFVVPDRFDKILLKGLRLPT